MRAALLLVRSEGLKYREAAEVLGITDWQGLSGKYRIEKDGGVSGKLAWIVQWKGDRFVGVDSGGD